MLPNPSPLFPLHQAVFSCPLCKEDMIFMEEKSMICPNKHTFDKAKQGYINFLLGKSPTDYPKEMLFSRRMVAEAGFFTPLLDTLLTLLPSVGYLLDAGCGEGSHLAYLTNILGNTSQGVGIDISKDGILLAAKGFPHCLWTVGDLAAMPFADKTFSSVLNILSPANYKEFRRTLAPHGKVFKVVPNTYYLRELREAFHQRDDYSNEQVVQLFKQEYPVVETKEVSYKFTTTPDILPHIIAMSPISWQATQEQVQSVLASTLNKITLDFTILIGAYE